MQRIVSIFVYFLTTSFNKNAFNYISCFKGIRLLRRRGRDCINCFLSELCSIIRRKFQKDFLCLLNRRKIRNTLSRGKSKRFFRTPDKIVVQKSFYDLIQISYLNIKEQKRIHFAGK